MEFTAWLTANGYDAGQLTEPQKKHLQAAWKDETQPPAPPTPKPAESSATTFQMEMDAIRKEDERCAKIRKITSESSKAAIGNRTKIDKFEELCNTAINDKWNLQQFEIAMLREERSVGPMFHLPSKPQVTSSVVEAAVCRAGGLGSKALESDYDAQTLQTAHTQFKHGIGLHETIGLCARANGWHGDSVKRDLNSALRYAFKGAGEPMAAIGGSTLDIAGILSNIANKFVREQFMFGEQTFRKISAFRPVNDLKQITTYSLTGDLSYTKVAPGGEIKHGTLGNTVYNNQAATYAKLLGIDRTQLINDDLNALSQAGARLGRGAILKLNDVFWTVFLGNSAFFTSGNGNYQSGTNTLMDLTGMKNAYTLFLNQTDPDGKPLGIMPMIILVPPGLISDATTLLFSQTLNLATSTAASTGTKSPWEGLFTLEMSRYLANSTYTGYSALAWYMLASPLDTPVIETCFLNGVEVPTIETTEMDFDRLGIAMRAYHDFGVALQEYRGGLKSKGEA